MVLELTINTEYVNSQWFFNKNKSEYDMGF